MAGKKTKKLGIGIIGTGGISVNQHMPAYKAAGDLCEIVAVCDVVEEGARKAAEKFDVKNVYTDYNELLKRDDIDAVSVCTPNLYHHDPTVAALKAGKDVYVEKPLAATLANAEDMVRVAEETGRQLMCGLNRRFDGSTQALKKLVDEGRLGEPYWARAQALRRRGIPGWGVFIEKDKQGGGPLIDIGVHIIDTTLFLMGMPKPVAVSGQTYQKFGKRGDVLGLMGQWDHTRFTVEDFASAVVRFDDGATLMIESSFVANLPSDVYDTTILGDQGGLTLNPPRLYTESSMQLLEIAPTSIPQQRSHEKCIGAFVRALVDGAVVPIPGEQALQSSKIIEAIYRSSDEGKEVAV